MTGCLLPTPILYKHLKFYLENQFDWLSFCSSINTTFIVGLVKPNHLKIWMCWTWFVINTSGQSPHVWQRWVSNSTTPNMFRYHLKCWTWRVRIFYMGRGWKVGKQWKRWRSDRCTERGVWKADCEKRVRGRAKIGDLVICRHRGGKKG